MTQGVKSLGATLFSSWYMDRHVTLKTRPDMVPPHRVTYEQRTERVRLPFDCSSAACTLGAAHGLHSQCAGRYSDDTNEQSEVQPREEESRYDEWTHVPGLGPDLSPGIPANEALSALLFRTVECGWEGALETCKDWVGQLYELMKMNRSLWKPQFLGKGFSVVGWVVKNRAVTSGLIWGAGKASPPSPHWPSTQKSHHQNPLFGRRQTFSKYILLNTPY